jgi:hypothetical protein
MQIYLTLAFLFIILCLLLKFPSAPAAPSFGFDLEVREKYDCQSGTVRCVNTCDHLCTESNFSCVNHACVSSPPDVECNTEKGGVLVFRDLGDWRCVCKYPYVYDGPTCDDTNPEFCEEGTIVHRFNKIDCDCPSPKTKIEVNGFVYCKSLRGLEKWF